MANIKKIAFYGGSFDPMHIGHMAVANALMTRFAFDKFVFVPAFHAPHKKRKKPTSALDRHAMLCLATNSDPNMKVSKMEIEVPERPYTLQTLTRLKGELVDTDIFFVMGADSWEEITTWHEWETVLMLTNHVVVTRPGFPIDVGHVTDAIRERIVDLRNGSRLPEPFGQTGAKIYLTDPVDVPVSSTEIRQKIRDDDATWRQDVPAEVAKYIEKYQIYS